MSAVLQDLRYTVRGLLRNPGLTGLAVLSLALGIGVSGAVFSVVRATLLRPLPYEDPDRLVVLAERNPQRRISWSPGSAANFHDWREQSRLYDKMAAVFDLSVSLAQRGEPERLRAKRVTSSFFSLLGVRPAAGRLFQPPEDQSGAEPVVVLSDQLWRRRFSADPAVIGESLMLDGTGHTIVGVLAPDFRLFPRAELFFPNPFASLSPTERQYRLLYVLARLKPTVTIEQAQAEMDVISERLAGEYPDSNQGWAVSVIPLHNDLIGRIETRLLALLGAVGFLLLIACGNLSSLLLARGASRQREFAIRAVLGAGRFRLVGQSLTESALLGVMGGVGGLLVCQWAIRLLMVSMPSTLVAGNFFRPQVSLQPDEIGVDWVVLGFMVLVSLGSGLVIGIVPGMLASRPDLNGALKDSARTGTNRGHRRALSLLVAGEIAVSLLLLVGSGLMINSFLRLSRLNLGFDAENLLALHLSLPLHKYAERAGAEEDRMVRLTPRRDRFLQQVMGRLRALPEVEAAAATSGTYRGGDAWLDGEAKPQEGRQRIFPHYVTSDFFTTMGIPLKRGRSFTARDVEGAPRVAIVNEAMAKRYWAGQDVLHRRMTAQETFDAVAGHWAEASFEVVGVAADARTHLRIAPLPTLYLPYAQQERTMADADARFRLNFTSVVRTRGDPATLASAARRAVWQVDPEQPISGIEPLSAQMDRPLEQPRFYTRLLSAFAAAAFGLALIGVYGVTSYSVAKRRHEIGIRMSLGADKTVVERMILKQGLKLTLAAVAIGVAASLGLTRFLRGLLFEVQPHDPLTFLIVCLAVVAVALAACYIPARRATKVDPLVALRHE